MVKSNVKLLLFVTALWTVKPGGKKDNLQGGRGRCIYCTYLCKLYNTVSEDVFKAARWGADHRACPRCKPGFASGERLNSAVIFGSILGISAFFSWGKLPYHIHCWLVSKRWSLERDLFISSHKIKHVPCIPPNIIFFLCDILWHILLFFHRLWEEIWTLFWKAS